MALLQKLMEPQVVVVIPFQIPQDVVVPLIFATEPNIPHPIRINLSQAAATDA